MAELRCDLMISGSRYARSDQLLLLYREEAVAVDSDYGAVGPDGTQSLLDSASSAAHIVAVYRTAEIPV